MSLAQLQALTGRKIRPSYVEEINAQTPYLPGIYAQKRNQQYLDQQNELNQQGLLLAQNEADSAEKYRKRAERLGYVNTALNAGLGIADLASAYDWGGGKSSASTAGGLSIENATDILTGMGANSYKAPIDSGSNGFDLVTDILKPTGKGLLDFGKGIYENTIGNILDIF